MIEPVEAELARPPIFTNKQEAILRDENIEQPDAIVHGSSTTINGADRDVEKAPEGRIIVDYTPGAGEDPHEWAKWR
jgi:hypothetical protein